MRVLAGWILKLLFAVRFWLKAHSNIGGLGATVVAMSLSTKIPERFTSSARSRGRGRKAIGTGERVATSVALGFVGLLVLAFTLGKAYLSFGPLWQTSVHRHRSLDLVLFNGFDYPSVWWGPWTNLFGNILLFLPLGFLVANMLRGRTRFPVLETILLSFVGSFAIEATQFAFALGYSDIDDLLFNTIGGAIGATLAAQMGPRWRALFIGLSLLAALLGLTVMLATSVF